MTKLDKRLYKVLFDIFLEENLIKSLRVDSDGYIEIVFMEKPTEKLTYMSALYVLLLLKRIDNE